MITKRSRWSDPAIIVAALAVVNGGYWQYRAMGRADSDSIAAASASLTKQVADNERVTDRLDIRLTEHERRLDRLERRR